MPYGFNDNKSKYDLEQMLSTKADKTSPELEGIPTAPTATLGTNNGQIATTAFVQATVSGKQKLITISSNAPVGGVNGDIWIQY